MIITSCGNSQALAKRVAKALRATFVPLEISSFPDGDIYLRFTKSVKKKHVVIINSFQPHPDMTLFDTLVAAQTAKDLGAKKVTLLAPYLAYMRQDKRFHPGEAITSKIMANLLNQSIDELITIDPHIHRYKSLKDIFTVKTKKLTANPLIVEFLKKKKKNAVIVGPDWESYQWAQVVAQKVGCQVTCLEKTRYSSRKVSVKMVDPIDIKGKNVFMIDDIISTGHTIAQAAKKVKKLGAKTVTAIGVHGLFVEDAITKLKKAGVTTIISSNTIEHKTNKIDVLPLLKSALRK